MPWSSLVRQGFRSGGTTARLIRRRGLRPRFELLALATSLLLLLIGLVCVAANAPFALPVFVLAAIAFATFFTAVSYNELCRKQKTAGEYLTTLPALFVYYFARTAGYVRG